MGLGAKFAIGALTVASLAASVAILVNRPLRVETHPDTLKTQPVPSIAEQADSLVHAFQARRERVTADLDSLRAGTKSNELSDIYDTLKARRERQLDSAAKANGLTNRPR